MSERQPSVTVRILVVVVVIPLCSLLVFVVVPEAVGRVLEAPFVAWFSALIILGPALIYRGSGSSSGPSDADGGGGTGPRRSPSPPSAPRTGPPLPDADQARERVRDHDRPDRGGVRPRRPARQPERAPAAMRPGG